MNLTTHVSISSLVRVKSGAIDRMGIYLKRSGHTPEAEAVLENDPRLAGCFAG
jgi:hypothetical protein